MTELSEIDFGRLDVRDGDVLVLKVPGVLPRSAREGLTSYVQEGLGTRFEEITVLILDAGADIAVLRKEAVEANPT